MPYYVIIIIIIIIRAPRRSTGLPADAALPAVPSGLARQIKAGVYYYCYDHHHHHHHHPYHPYIVVCINMISSVIGGPRRLAGRALRGQSDPCAAVASRRATLSGCTHFVRASVL